MYEPAAVASASPAADAFLDRRVVALTDGRSAHRDADESLSMDIGPRLEERTMAQHALKPTPPRRWRGRKLLLVVFVAVLILGAAAASALLAVRGTGERAVASASLKLPDGRAVGQVDFFDAQPGVVVRARVELPAGVAGRAAFHGFHVHANDDATNGNGCVAQPDAAPKTWFVSADAHLDHDGHPHPEHGGDLPSVYVMADGHGYLEFRTDRLSAADLTGRAVVLHAGPDNFGRVPVGATGQDYTANSAQAAKTTLQGGNSGDRIACGVIGAPASD
jgi:superoxide dismutase, Cu-Zn family